jgi:hypothetical protein
LEEKISPSMDPELSKTPPGEQVSREQGSPPASQSTTPPLEVEGGPEALHRFVQQIPEILEYCSLYFKTQIDRAKFSGRKILLGIILSLIFLILIVQIAYLSLSQLFQGLAEGIGEFFGARHWLGNVIVGGAFVLAFVLAILLFYRRLTRSAFKKTVKAYEDELYEQEKKYGHNIADQALSSQE